jgi:Ca-activated chloride channel family protein
MKAGRFMVHGLWLTTLAASAATDITAPPPKLYNQGNQSYRQQQFDQAAQAYQQSLASKDQALRERAFYNLGNAYYRLADPLEATAPDRAQDLFKQSLSCYDSALALDPKDADAAFNKQMVEVRLKKLQQQQQQQKQQKQQNQQQQQQQQAAQPRQGEQQKQEQQQPQQQQQQPAGQQQQQEQPRQPRRDGDEDKPRDMSEMEAKLLLDAEREEEKHWKEIPQLRSLGQRDPEKNW